jgi:hypothetical protein
MRIPEEAPLLSAAFSLRRRSSSDLRAHRGGWVRAEANLAGCRHASALDTVPLVMTASRLQGEVRSLEVAAVVGLNVLAFPGPTKEEASRQWRRGAYCAEILPLRALT